VLFFFEEEGGIRDWSVTGVQTCALPIFFQTAGEDEIRLEGAIGNRRLGDLAARDLDVLRAYRRDHLGRGEAEIGDPLRIEPQPQIGRASCRERGKDRGGGGVRKGKRVKE